MELLSISRLNDSSIANDNWLEIKIGCHFRKTGNLLCSCEY
ncbi:protein of unknown function [Candidatus Nitrosocosmicus franklandus]|uniref:Uncharacterized protein n=1 Tax=Candidatus Nitrosocosmicus franklandianus TaxID=1798806 RepID=A0A484IAZ4_9ARCH|nr:protein of unknown function [Candidatus Nitrosocosmicus franklandus]